MFRAANRSSSGAHRSPHAYVNQKLQRQSSWCWAVCRSKHVKPLMNGGIINYITRLHPIGYFSRVIYYGARIHEYWISIDRWDFFPINHFTSLVFKSICFIFFWRRVHSISTCNRSVVPRYFTTSVWGMIVWLMVTAVQWPFQTINVMCDDLDSLNLIFNFCVLAVLV
jgi:hypothetical protein